ncbi:hypothetical protein D9Q98_001933 [Chlorella vulgaris]|uniref:DNA-(apurinic or apyrimidinic site) lyase n=1 Tax=Chlorella vulgaris TaxID=3077 RepID=A0A9D4TVV6_CHLVU|nr:hypothetical protein D9Q98_001933 [Chlorella vulgaris]
MVPEQDEGTWCSLGTPASELRLEWTLPTGQSFRWRQTADDPLEFTGVVGQRAVRMRQLPGDVQYQVIARGSCVDAAGDDVALRDYFNLSTSLAELSPSWCAACPRYALVHRHLPGARMLRQDPVECLFAFICSQNNHIQRIHGMVERLCRQHGTPLCAAPALAAAGKELAAGAAPAGLALHAFPTLEQLSAVTEEQLRGDGFGYRAKYVTGSVAQLLDKPGGGVAWLMALRDVPFEDAVEALCTLHGIGPKVAACIALFSLDKHAAIPVDTHVFSLACKYYTPHLRSKSLTKKVHGEVQQALVTRFGPYAGWAHNALFIAELATTRDKVPALGGGSKRTARTASSSSSEDGSGDGGDSDAGEEQVCSPAGAVAKEAAAPAAEPLLSTPPGTDSTGAQGQKRQSRRRTRTDQAA